MSADDDSTLTIGGVVDELRGEFPDLSISKIRFLESKGLVDPPRATSGYRRFRRDDVDRLRYILTAQRDHFWPLKVIQDALDALDRGLAPAPGTNGRPSVPESTAAEVPAADELTAPVRAMRLTRGELAHSAGMSEGDIDDLVRFGLLAADVEGHFDASALAVSKAAAGLASYGLEPRHLRAFRTAADREVGLVEQVTSTMRSGAAANEEAVGELLHLCLALHASLVRAALARRAR